MACRKITRIEPGYPLLLGANKVAEGYNFAVEIPDGTEASLLLYRKNSRKPVQEISFEKGRREGDISALLLEDFIPEEYEYNFRIDGSVVQDPCAYSILGREQFGVYPDSTEEHKIRCGFLPEKSLDWENADEPKLSYDEMILYKLHVRGYTKQAKISPKKRGTFSGLIEMIPYLEELGINAVELMPAYDFMEVLPSDGKKELVSTKKDEKVNFWGYVPGFYFAPKRTYCATSQPEIEFGEMIKSFHRAGIECIMEFYFPREMNPLVVLRALQFWKLHYHVDGFHLIGEGVPINLLLNDGVLSHTKLILNHVPVGEIPEKRKLNGKYLAESQAGFMQDMRRYLKSDEETVQGAANRIRENYDTHAVIHYMACQDGFTLADAVSYNYKHNEENGEDNKDGTSYNFSWNCGAEGPSRKASIRQMRERQMRNAFLMLLLSQGVPMIYGGDEIANSQEGNNNAYCQDNPIGWIDWKSLKKNEKLLSFVKEAIAFRKEHPVLHQPKALKGVDYLTRGFPDISFHGERAWYCSSENTSRLLGVLYCGYYAKKTDGTPDEHMYVAYNFHWENRTIALPNLPNGIVWKKAADTSDASGHVFFEESEETYQKTIEIPPRTIVVLLGRQEA